MNSARRKAPAWLSVMVALLMQAAAMPALPATPQSTYSPAADQSYPDNVYRGDTHLHTYLSGDAFSLGNRITPDDLPVCQGRDDSRRATRPLSQN
jgi:hypothetical protein